MRMINDVRGRTCLDVLGAFTRFVMFLNLVSICKLNVFDPFAILQLFIVDSLYVKYKLDVN